VSAEQRNKLIDFYALQTSKPHPPSHMLLTFNEVPEILEIQTNMLDYLGDSEKMAAIVEGEMTTSRQLMETLWMGTQDCTAAAEVLGGGQRMWEKVAGRVERIMGSLQRRGVNEDRDEGDKKREVNKNDVAAALERRISRWKRIVELQERLEVLELRTGFENLNRTNPIA
jgi:hypothetical protein